MSSSAAASPLRSLRLSSSADALDERLLCLGDDAEGMALEVMVVEGSKGELVVIHAMELRAKYRDQYEEAKQWRL
jgi:hypothetical protein